MEGSGDNNQTTTTTSITAASSPSPWTQIVRGPESDPAGAPSSPSAGDRNILSPATRTTVVENQNAESSDNGNAGGVNNKKPAWNKKPVNVNGSVETGAVVMGAASWPALSESTTKGSPKLSSSDSSKSLSDSGSNPPPQVTGIVLPPSSLMSSPLQSPSSQPSLSSPKLTSSNVNVNVSHSQNPNNHGRPARQKSMKRDGGGGNSNAQANGGFSHQSSTGEGSGSHNNNHNSSVKASSGGGYESSSRDHGQNHGNRDVGSRNAGGDHPQPRNSFRRGNGGPHSRGDGHQNYGGRRGDQDRGNHDWNHQRSFNGRDAPLQPRVSPRGYVRNPPVSAPFVHPGGGPAPIRPFINPMGMPEMPMIYFQGSVPFVAPVGPVPPMFFPVPDPQLQVKILNQIDYYFSNENLVKDTYLRQNMDEEGWVHVALIAGFKKVMELTDNIQLILEAVKSSSVVEAQGDKIRRRGDWNKWIMPPAVKVSTASGSQSPKSPSVASVSAHIHNITLDEKTSGIDAEVLLRSSSGDPSSPSHTIKDGASSGGC